MGKLIYFLFFIQSASAAVNHPDGAIFLNKKAYAINFSEYFFKTSGHYDVQGHQNGLVDGESFNLYDTNVKISYGIESNFTVDFFTKFRMISSSVISGGTSKASSKSGIESGGVGLKYQLRPVGNTIYALAGEFRRTLYTNTKYAPTETLDTNNLVLGDDGNEYKVGMLVTSIFGRNRFDANLFYRRPANELSSEINYGAEYGYYFNTLAFMAGVDGIISLKKDPYTDDPTLKPKVYTGSTSLFNSINREVTNAYLGTNIDFKKNSTLEIRLGTTINGVSIDKGLFGLINFNWNTSGITKEMEKIESFKEYHIDGSVLKVSARGAFVKIDQGLSADVEKGMQFDIYQTDYFGGNILVALGYVTEVGSDWSVIKVVKKFAEIEIRPGFSARAK